jgi:hypothetical protein
MVMNQNTRIVDITVGELTDIIKSLIPTGIVKEEKPKDKWLVYGMKGLAGLFGCSTVTAWEIKKSGVIDKAISQMGRTIVVDAEKALELMRASNPKKYK